MKTAEGGRDSVNALASDGIAAECFFSILILFQLHKVTASDWRMISFRLISRHFLLKVPDDQHLLLLYDVLLTDLYTEEDPLLRLINYVEDRILKY